ncbi:NF038130 family PEP-CTERM protein [Anabaena sp. UHCC 0187]|uniref:NF038130 family PEP-CTERM protein n=1 Tax=Anabaena sp. UHCC 0187 TaxID=2590018 RepID=UPI001447BA80
MSKNLGKLLIGASMVIGMGALAANPVQAGTLTGATIGGTAANDYYVYDVVGSQTTPVTSNLTNVKKVLDGDAESPTGNVELRASTEQVGFNATEFAKNTTLEGKIGGKNITLSSLTSADWFGPSLNMAYGQTNLANTWFNQFYVAAGLDTKETQLKTALGLPLPNNTPNLSTIIRTSVFNVFTSIGGFQRASDPNIAYVNQDDNTGLIKIGLAGHLDMKSYYAPIFGSLTNLINNNFQASEVVKYTYNGVTDYLYSFTATNSGLTSTQANGDHSGNYEVTIVGVPRKAPEPSAMLGILGVAGVFAAQRKLKKASA